MSGSTGNFSTLHNECFLAACLHKSFILLSVAFIGGILAISLQGCSDEYPEIDNQPHIQFTGQLRSFSLDGVFGVKIKQSGTMSSRVEGNTTPSSGNSFNDGLETEYKLTEEDDHHFLVYYSDNVGDDNSLPLLVIPLTPESQTTEGVAGGDIIDDDGNYTTYDNITLLAKNVFSFNDFVQADNDVPVKKDELLNLIRNKTGYILANFDKSITVTSSLTRTPVTTGNNAEFLASISRKDFLEKMEVNDYKITVDGTPYFVMSTAVYGNVSGTSLQPVYAYNNLDSEDYIYTSKAEALKGTALISGYVERLAAKYTVGFDLSEYQANTTSNKITGFTEADPSTGLPSFELYINKYTNISFDNNGYSINSEPTLASINVVGYAFSNVETTTNLNRYFSSNKNYFANWSDPGNFRCYWSEDPHYTLEKPGNGSNSASASGYPQQWRVALETDTITSLHAGEYIFEEDPVYDEVITSNANGSTTSTKYYRTLGEPDYSKLNAECVLKYKSFDEMLADYADSKKNNDSFYTLENTYSDPGMADGNNLKGSWVWPWRKAAYSTATNIILLCQMQIRDNTTTEGTAFYRDQNNIYYLGESELLSSKLEILNKVMLSGGNAGLQILHAHWDSHTPHEVMQDYESNYNGVYLDKVAWNMNSLLWIHGPNPHNGNTVEYWIAGADDMVLIPSEMSGGDGQRLIAPRWMGSEYTYHLAPEKNQDEIDDDPINESGSTKVVQINYNHLVALIHKIIGPIDVFTNGYMYYASPVPHSASSLTMTGPDPAWHTLGNIGVVRNCWYNVTVKGISDVGTSVDVTGQPIVPVMETTRSYINLGVKLMDWHTISQGGIPLKPE